MAASANDVVLTASGLGKTYAQAADGQHGFIGRY